MEKVIEVYIPSEGRINIRSMRAMYGTRSRTEIYRKIKQGALPSPVEPGLWDVEEVRAALKRTKELVRASQESHSTNA